MFCRSVCCRGVRVVRMLAGGWRIEPLGSNVIVPVWGGWCVWCVVVLLWVSVVLVGGR